MNSKFDALQKEIDSKFGTLEKDIKHIVVELKAESAKNVAEFKKMRYEPTPDWHGLLSSKVVAVFSR
jgi:hypothetical protein